MSTSELFGFPRAEFHLPKRDGDHDFTTTFIPQVFPYRGIVFGWGSARTQALRVVVGCTSKEEDNARCLIPEGPICVLVGVHPRLLQLGKVLSYINDIYILSKRQNKYQINQKVIG